MSAMSERGGVALSVTLCWKTNEPEFGSRPIKGNNERSYDLLAGQPRRNSTFPSCV
jgi:hypothetical protein